MEEKFKRNMSNRNMKFEELMQLLVFIIPPIENYEDLTKKSFFIWICKVIVGLLVLWFLFNILHIHVSFEIGG